MAAAAVVSDDVIAEILAKLPVKSLLRFNCVCKTWYSILSDPQFSNHYSMRRPCSLLYTNLREFSTITPQALLTIKDMAPTPLPFPWETKPYSENKFLGSCNGLICVDHKSGLIVWNPSTRKFKKVPPPIWNLHREDHVGFGYDGKIDDYKLIWLSYGGQSCSLTDLVVFTLKSNTWSRRPLGHDGILGMSYSSTKSIGVLSNGAVHWFIRHLCDVDAQVVECILAVDLVTEQSRLLKFRHASLGVCPWLGSLEGCLCLCVDSDGDGDGDDVDKDLWVMKEYGVESSWIKLLSINLRGTRFLTFYPSLFSKEEGKEIVVAVCNGIDFLNNIVKFRVEEGTASFEETLLRVRSGIILRPLHMKESLVRI